MVTAFFEEKTYEMAYNLELALGSASFLVFSPGQVLEKLTGFDVAANPGPEHLIWQVLALPRPPGLALLPTHWAAAGRPGKGALPNRPVSLILQFKRPDYLYGPRASQWYMWRRPYFRFSRSAAQHNVLRRLERTLQGKAVVRYAAPAFHDLGELEEAQIRRRVIPLSGHVSPVTLGSHRVWTYIGPGTYGRGNPNGAEGPFERFESLFVPTSELLDVSTAQAALVPVDGLEDHLASVAEACRERNPWLRNTIQQWANGLSNVYDADRREPLVGSARFQQLVDYATVQTLMTRQQMSWWLLDGEEFAPTPTSGVVQ